MDALDSRQIDTRLGKLNVRIHRGPAKAHTMVFWHSLMLDAHMWRYQLDHFSSRYSMLFIDGPGHGRSAPLRRSFTLHDCTDAVIAVLDAMHVERCVMLGCSWGGMVTALLPAYHPTRCLAAVPMNTTLEKPDLLEYVVFKPSALYMGLGQSRLDPMSLAILRYIFRGRSDTANERYNEEVALKLSSFEPLSISWAMDSLGGRGPTSYEQEIARITVPVLVVAGSNDIMLTPTRTKRLAQQCSSGLFACVERSGHLTALDSPAQVNKLLDNFLRGSGL